MIKEELIKLYQRVIMNGKLKIGIVLRILNTVQNF